MTPRVFAAFLLLSLASVRGVYAQVPAFSRIFVVIFENKEYGDVIGNASAPYINSLARQYGLATSAFALAHPSLPNYMELTSGDTAFTTDCVGCESGAANIADRIEASGRTWTAYMEDMPAACMPADAGLYAAKHNPFVHYTDIVSNAARCTRSVVPYAQFASDLAANRLANFVWITPNLCNDMHDCAASAGDAWLASLVPQILQSPSFDNALLLVVWDEGTTNAGGGGHVPLIVVSPRTPAGLQVETTVTHDDVLRTIEDAWGLSPLGRSASATAMTAFVPGVAAPPPGEQVIHASDVSTIVGAWRAVADPSAADNVKLSYPDNGAAALASPAAAPASYVDATFQAQPGARYRVWLRVHAIGDSKWNDSVFVQFSDSVDASGRAIDRIGTTSGYVVNLWTCATCQSFGWGWQRNAYWLADSGDVWFPTAGAHTIRLQAREDGVEIDQIVISASTYATSAPGPVSLDTTIVPRTNGSASPPPPLPTLADIVLYAGDVTASGLHGAWVRASDPSAAGGSTLATPNAGVSNTAAALASPTDYVDVTFSAAANTPYTLWLRMQALGNDKFNDSVWVQFSDAQAGGAAVYRMGSTSALLVNLATSATAASLSGWGWQNGAYWLTQPATVTFASSGTHTMRVQTREDGAAIDQIVLSPSRYLTSPPGGPTASNVIVPK